MPVDEFGREIPSVRGGGRRSPSPPHYYGHQHHQQQQHQQYHHSSYEGGNNNSIGPPPGGIPSLLYEALPSSRYSSTTEERGLDRLATTDRRGGDRNSNNNNNDNNNSSHYHEDRPISRKRKHRSKSPPPPPTPSARRGGAAGAAGGVGSNNNNSNSNSNHHPREGKKGKLIIKPHPSSIYNEQPMLCQYLWKEANEGKSDQDYHEYRKMYCLNYVRMFFNQHMDDSWFRSLYSPLERYRIALQERDRAIQEAKAMAQELHSSLTKQAQLAGKTFTTSTTSSTSPATSDPSFFVLKARLGNGIRQAGMSDYYRHSASSSYHSSHQAMINPIPKTHMMDLANQVLPVHEIPPHVTDDQLTAALMQNVTISKETSASVTLYSGSLTITTNDMIRTAYLYAPTQIRTEIIQQLTTHLDRRPTTTTTSTNNVTSSSSSSALTDTSHHHVPRKEDTYPVPKSLELVVECSDAYGRSEIDADGKGGQPEETSGVPPRQASVYISTKPSISPHVQVLSAALSSKQRIYHDQQATYQLAKAYDARRNIPIEYRLETILPQAVPNINIINTTTNTTTLPSQPQLQQYQQDIEDALDVTIAYLRRVHLFSFYNACTVADRVAEVLDGNHAASTIHLRLANADEILESKEKENNNEATPVVDLLVQRLDNSIQKALEEVRGWETTTTSSSSTSQQVIVDTETDLLAKQIEHDEKQVEDGWVQDHSVIDQNGRARCSFHFCRKLFKDSKFLKKHLIKKHSEFLRAEIAKCHDSYMMKAWDAQEQRPVPPILVDCGHRFGLKPSVVLGSTEPLAADPEPDLWRRELERREMAEKEAEVRRDRYDHTRKYPATQEQGPAPSLDAPLSEDRGQGGGGGGRHHREKNHYFVDVDDMKEEKVDMVFDTVEIPVVPPKKKKKKKLLL
jgi:hypothetical protein